MTICILLSILTSVVRSGTAKARRKDPQRHCCKNIALWVYGEAAAESVSRQALSTPTHNPSKQPPYPAKIPVKYSGFKHPNGQSVSLQGGREVVPHKNSCGTFLQVEQALAQTVL